MLELLAGIQAAQRATKRSLELEPERRRRAPDRRPRLAAACGVVATIATSARRRERAGRSTRPGGRACPDAQLD